MTDQSAPAAVRPPSIFKEYERQLPVRAPFIWLRDGLDDCLISPLSSLAYGLAVFLVSVLFVGSLWQFGFSYMLLPVVAGFMVVGPVIAIALYEKSRLIREGASMVTLKRMLRVKAKSSGQLFFIGAILMLVFTFWLRAAVMLYALFFGLAPFGGFEDMMQTLFFTQTGLTLLLVGSIVGGVFAGFSFAISAFSIPLLMNEEKDTVSAMAVSVAMSMGNKAVVFLWGLCVLALFLVSVATAFVGLILVFPVLGHATWHAYKALRVIPQDPHLKTDEAKTPLADR